MSRARSWRLCLRTVVVGLWLAWAPPLEAAVFTLTPRDREEALRIGRRSIVSDDFGAEWRVEDASGQRLNVMTPFHRLALAARNSAFQDRELKPKDVESLLKEHQGKLVFWATLRGSRVDFARFYSPTLLSRRQEIKATFTQNERTALRGEDGRYSARCMYVFAADELDPKGVAVLIVRDADEKQVAKFTVDLSAMR